jgi:hypothetical protein
VGPTDLLIVCVPVTLIGLIVIIVLALAVDRSRERSTVVGQESRPINRWGLAYFAIVTTLGVSATAYLLLSGQLRGWTPVLCAYGIIAIAAPFVAVGLYRALRWARIL